MPKSTKQPEEKTFSLKDIELRVIANINKRSNEAMLDHLSFVAIERLAYNVTEQTQFRVDDGKLYISETPTQEEKEVEVA